ncbi:hypothetical protein ACH34E_17295 [Elizabethkingia anophelis]|uniref:hypothetical protein n=1 Tax=Elizabethkingia anophelis TaxID=1117645 RepID=UPI00389191F1|nr:hypothetical protein [Elizabethkingia anophelis]
MYVIFDTNATREYVAKINEDQIDEFATINSEKLDKQNIKLLLSPIVMMELLYHISDKSDPHFNISYKSLKAIFLTQEKQNITLPNHYMAAPENLIANDLFKMKIDTREEMYSRIMYNCKLIAHNTIGNLPDLQIEGGGTIRSYIDEIEESFANQVDSLIVTNFDRIAKLKNTNIKEILNSDHGDFALSLYIIRTTYTLLAKEGKIPYLQDNMESPFNPKTMEKVRETKKQCIYISSRYPAFLSLFKEVINRFIDSGKEMKKEKLKNYIWDILLMFNVSNLTMNGEDIIFVTSDKAMLLAAQKVDSRLTILTLNEFKEKYL